MARSAHYRPVGATPALTPREREVLELLSEGYTGEEAAAVLVLSPETIKTHIRNSSRKLNARTRTHLIALALRHGELDL